MNKEEYIPGLITAVAISSLSLFISGFHASFDPLVISIIIGMFLGNLLAKKEYFEGGIEASIKVFLPAGIALYGAQLVVHDITLGVVGGLVAVFSVMFGLALVVSKVFNINNKVAVLIASGLAVCGTAAITIISPLIKARRSDTSISIISVMMLGLTAMILYPLLFDYLALTTNEFAFLSGATLPMLGQVKVAAGSICEDCLSVAVKIKLFRISFLFFLITVVLFLSGTEGKRIAIPWFIVLFVVLAVAVNITEVFDPYLGHLRKASSFFLSTALAGIGFTADFDSIVENGMAPLGTAFLSWGVVIILTYIVMSLL